MESMFKMTKSIIEQELERLDRDCINDHCDDCTNSSIQKALEELKKKIIQMEFTKVTGIGNIGYIDKIVKWSDVEKCFGVGK